MLSAYAWLFNNPRHSDAYILITNRKGSVAECQTKRNRNQTADHDPLTPHQPTSPEIARRTLHAHRVVLESNSEYFPLGSGFAVPSLDDEYVQSDEPASDTAAEEHITIPQKPLGKRPRDNEMKKDQQQLIVLRVDAPELVPLAEAMIQFMYTHELDLQLSIQELLQLMKLADTFAVVALKKLCIEKVKEYDFAKMSAEELLEVAQLPDLVPYNPDVEKLVDGLKNYLVKNYEQLKKLADDQVGDDEGSSSSSSSSGAAAALMELALGHCLDLGAIWAEPKANKTKYICIKWGGFAFVHALLSRNDLKVPSENLVLEVVVSWVASSRCTTTPEKGCALMRLVRLAQLRPAYIAMIRAAWNGDANSITQTMAWEARLGLKTFLAANEDMRAALLNNPVFAGLGPPRQQCRPVRASFEVSIDAGEVTGAATRILVNPGQSQQCLTPGKAGPKQYMDGWLAAIECSLRREEGGLSAALVVEVRYSLPKAMAPLVTGDWSAELKHVVRVESEVLGVCVVEAGLIVGFAAVTHDRPSFEAVVLKGLDLYDPLSKLPAPVGGDGTIGALRVTLEMP